MARELRKAFSSLISNTAKVVDTFAQSYHANSKIEVAENLSEAEIKGTESANLKEKAETVKDVWESLM